MVGRTSSLQAITVTNNESVPITLKLIAVAGKDFSATNNCGATLAGKTSCTISWDSHMDCQYSIGSTPTPYPQYYVYQLLSSPNYLGLNSGGYMAASVSPPVSGAGLAVTGLYNTTHDAILQTNPTAKNYSQISISARNVGFTSPRAVLYQIVNGRSITQSSLPLTRSSDGKAYAATISLPPHTVFAISIQGP